MAGDITPGYITEGYITAGYIAAAWSRKRPYLEDCKTKTTFDYRVRRAPQLASHSYCQTHHT